MPDTQEKTYTQADLYEAYNAGKSGMSFASATGVSEEDIIRAEDGSEF